MTTLKNDLANYLISLGINPAYKGFGYLLDVLVEIIENNITTDLKLCEIYNQVAPKHNVSGYAIERAIERTLKKAPLIFNDTPKPFCLFVYYKFTAKNN